MKFRTYVREAIKLAGALAIIATAYFLRIGDGPWLDLALRWWWVRWR